MSTVSYQGIVKSFGPFKALHSLDLALPDSTFLALLGPSGCGKTTALRILAGLEMPTAGDACLIGDTDVTRLQPRDRDVAMVFQSYALYPHMTIAENIGYPLKIRKFRAASVGSRSPMSPPRLRSTICSSAIRAIFPEASASELPWRERSSGIPLPF